MFAVLGSDMKLRLEHFAAIRSGSFLSLAVVVAMLWASPALCQLGGRGPDPIASFRQDVGGGSAIPTSFSVTFDPASSYLPVPSDPSTQSYQYTLIWDFGDGSTQQVGPAAFPAALATVQHNYTAERVYVVTLRIDVTIITGAITSAGTSSVVKGQVRSAFVNYAPVGSLLNMVSAPSGALPYELKVDVASTFDEDGYISWAAINWGDGSYTLIQDPDISLPSKTVLPYTHFYTTSGNYTVTLSVIDNGRIPIDPSTRRTMLQSAPPANDPAAALASITAFQTSLINSGILNAGFDDIKYHPKLRDSFIQVVVPGNLLVTKGAFKLKFQELNSDSFDSTFDLNVPVADISNAKVTINLGSGPNSQVLQQFTTDLKGNFFDQGKGLQFSINPRKRFVRVKITKTALRESFQISNTTVVNGFVDVPVLITVTGVSGTSSLASKLRFVYNAKAGISGAGKNPRSQNN